MLTFFRPVFFAFALAAVTVVAHADESTPAAGTAVATPKALAQAVKARRVVTFVYQGQPRTVEPHACGITVTSGEAVLHGYQIEGGSASGIPPGWRTFSVAKISEFALTEKTFAAPRTDYAAGRPHLDPLWAEIEATKTP